jgi:hypothetical protein
MIVRVCSGRRRVERRMQQSRVSGIGEVGTRKLKARVMILQSRAVRIAARACL